MKNVPDDAQQEEFARYIVKWQRMLNLDDWRIEKGTKRSKAMAEVSVSYADRLATYRIGTFGSTAITPESLETTALHELLHVLLADLNHCADADKEAAEHRVVNTLEKLLMRLNLDSESGKV